MEVTVWGARGSIPVSGPEFVRHGGDTTCLEVRGAGEPLIVRPSISCTEACASRQP